MFIVNVLCVFGLINSILALPTLRSGCTVDAQDGFGKPQTLILKPDSDVSDYDAFYLPTHDEQIHFKDDDVVIFACPGGDLKVSGTNTRMEQAAGVCSNDRFEIEGKSVEFSDITCSKLPYHTARYTGASCLDNKREIEVGFLLKTPERFIRQLTICFDDVLLSNLYSSFTISKSIGAYQSGTARPNFVGDNFYPFNVNSFYVRNKQRATINGLVGLSSGSTKYIAASSDFFLSRGHMAAKADFIYGAQQRATFHYVNVAPQWQTFNGRNWNTLEMDIRSYVSNTDSFDTRYTLYTGTHGVTTLRHEETGEDVELYLHVDGNKKTLPVPQFYWRVLRNEDTQHAIAFVGINNPYHKNVTNEIICENICNQLSWLSWKAESIENGYSYCCTVDDLRKTVTNVPEFSVEGVLL